MKINLGSGPNPKEGWINVDIDDYGNSNIKKIDLTKVVPFEDNSVDEILMDNFIEHIPRERYFWFLEEIYRICKDGAKIVIYTPHFTGISAFQHPGHYNYYGVGSFDTMNVDCQENFERYCKVKFKVKPTLLFFHHNLYTMTFLSKLNKFINWCWNINPMWQRAMERFNVFGFDEIKFVLIIEK